MARRLIKLPAVTAVILSAAVVQPALADGIDRRIIHISVDGMGWTYAQSLINSNPALLPNMVRFETEGAWTNNARNDNDYTITLPNHTTQITGRAVSGADGHNWTANTDPLPGQTIASNKGSYVAGVFDVAHDEGLRTAMFVGKSKFSLYDTSYNASNGAPDAVAPYFGTDKIDAYANVGTATQVVSAFITDSNAAPARFAFLHFADPDTAGHASGWGSAAYNQALGQVDAALGTLFSYIAGNSNFHDKTFIVLTADHGGGGGAINNHADITSPLNYTIPFWIWGPGVAVGDLYALNASTRVNPGTSKILYNASIQPVRNGDAANVELGLLGLGPVPGSTINTPQNLSFLADTGNLIWNGHADGTTWNTTAANWFNGSNPQSRFTNGMRVTFDDSAPDPAITLNISVSPQSLTVNSSANHFTISGPGSLSGSTAVTKGGTSTFTLNIPVDYSGPTTINAGLLVFAGAQNAIASVTGAGSVQVSPAASLVSDAVVVSSLVINGSHTIRSNGSGSNASRLNALFLASDANGTFTATLDLTDNKLIVQASDAADKATKIADFNAAITAGSNGATWTGNGITSSTAAGDPNRLGVGLFDNAILNKTSFGGQPTDTHSILIAISHLGDANRNGIVDIQDVAIVADNWQQPRNNWAQGDLSRNGIVDIQDFSIVANNWQLTSIYSLDPSLSPIPYPLPPESVPEPSTLLLWTFSPLLLKRSKSRRTRA